VDCVVVCFVGFWLLVYVGIFEYCLGVVDVGDGGGFGGGDRDIVVGFLCG